MKTLTKDMIVSDWRKCNLASSIGAWVGFLIGFVILGIMAAAVSLYIMIVVAILFVTIGVFLWRTISARNGIAVRGEYTVFQAKVKSRLIQKTKEDGTLLCFQMDHEDYVLTLTGPQKKIEAEFDEAIEGITEYYVVQIGRKALRYPTSEFTADEELLK